VRGAVLLDTKCPSGVCWYDLSIEGKAEKAVKRSSVERLSCVGVFSGFRGLHSMATVLRCSMMREAWGTLASAGISVEIVEEED
jgi:hypothetical protein